MLWIFSTVLYLQVFLINAHVRTNNIQGVGVGGNDVSKAILLQNGAVLCSSTFTTPPGLFLIGMMSFPVQAFCGTFQKLAFSKQIVGDK